MKEPETTFFTIFALGVVVTGVAFGLGFALGEALAGLFGIIGK